MNRKERSRAEMALLVGSGFYYTCDHWTRVLLPFFQWQLLPPGNFQIVVMVTAIGAISTGIGSFIVGHMIELLGIRKTAIIITLITALYQVLITKVSGIYVFIALQSLLFFNNLPVVIDALVCQMEGEDGDDKKRSLLISRLTIPQSIAYALGPYLALQTLFIITAFIHVSQYICVALHLLTVLPLIFMTFPEREDDKKFKLTLPSLTDYYEIMKNERISLCLGLLFAVVGPYQAYDQVIRAQLTGAVVRDPTSIIYVILLGSFTVLTASYIHLSFTSGNDYYRMLGGLCIQVAFVAVAIGELSSQILSTVSKKNAGKVAALLRSVHLLGAGMTPLIAGVFIEEHDYALLCHCGALISILAIPVVYKFGKFMKSQSAFLPMTGVSFHSVPKLD
ncbi:unnamed protein product, partial [Mesorhabditis belari]|uniref:Uncharacterized protein n=1 Tax=Mesorhabditis belari TaxID=2138241 RepID=A0AAF3F685_9BILA